MKAITKYIFTICSLILSFSTNSQNIMTSSPYSMFGLGELTSGLYGQNSAMGGVSYGMRDVWLMNTENPAGLTALDSLKIYAETSAFIKGERYYSKGSSNNAFTGNMSEFKLGGRIMKRWYSAVGVSPYTSVGYYFYSIQPLEGTSGSSFASLFEGNGGLSKVHLTNAFLLPYNFSVGVNLNYIFGNISHTETQSTMNVEQKMYTQTFYADFGLQYYRPLGKNTFLTLGAVYGYRQKIKLDNSTTVTSSYSQTEYTNRKITQYLPMYYGVGGTLQYKKMLYGLDYSFHEYGDWSSGSSQVKFQDTHEVRSGVSFDPQGQAYDSYFKQVKYKAGFDVSTPYYLISGKSGLSWRASVGAAFPIFSGYLNTAFFYDRTQINGGALRKNIIGLTVTYTLSERMYRVKL